MSENDRSENIMYVIHCMDIMTRQLGLDEDEYPNMGGVIYSSLQNIVQYFTSYLRKNSHSIRGTAKAGG